MHRELLRRRPHIPLLIPIRLDLPQQRSHEHIAPYVEFAVVVEVREEVLLEDYGAVVGAAGVEQGLDLGEGLRDGYAGAAVGVLAGF